MTITSWLAMATSFLALAPPYHNCYSQIKAPLKAKDSIPKAN